MNKPASAYAEKLVVTLTLLILAVVPFHALLTTWAGSSFGNIDVWRIWKEILLTLALPASLYLLSITPDFRRWLGVSWLPRLIFAYALLHIISGIVAAMIDNVNGPALLYAWFANLRYLAFFLLMALIAFRLPNYRIWALRAVGMSAGVVLTFGILQLTVLPTYFLENFGYGNQTIPAVQTVDNKLSYQRIQSTLRGANPYGAYLVVILSVLGSWILWVRHRRWLAGGVLLVAVVSLWFTYSRSALVGALVAGTLLLFMWLPARYRELLVIGSVVILSMAAGAVYLLRDNDIVQNSIFHSDEKSQSKTSSNFDRLGALQRGASDVAANPLGQGPGTAGPASTRNDRPARIAENYFLQIGQEVGWLGLGLLMAISALVLKGLWRVRTDWVAAGLLAAFAGLTVVNLLSHAWTDDTLGLMWWGLAGVVYGSAIITRKKANNKNAST